MHFIITNTSGSLDVLVYAFIITNTTSIWELKPLSEYKNGQSHSMQSIFLNKYTDKNI